MTDRDIGWFMVLLCGAGLIKRLVILSRDMTTHSRSMTKVLRIFLSIPHTAPF